MKKTAIFFDFDGVIADTRWFSINSLRYAAEKMWLERSDHIFFKFFEGSPVQDGTTKRFRTKKKMLKKVDLFINYKLEYDNHYLDEAIFYDDALPFIEKMYKKYDLFIVTWSRKKVIDMFMKEYSLGKYFKDIITSEDYEKWKPNPEPYVHALKKHTLRSENVLVLEDSPAGYKAAKKAWLDIISVSST